MTSQPSRRVFLASAGAVLASPAMAATPYWPGAGDWATVSPEAAGFDPVRLTGALDAIMARKSVSTLVLRGGRMVAERYAAGWPADRAREVASVGKSMTSVLVGMAIDDGKIKGVDQPAADFIPQWRGTPKEKILIRHLLSMTSGLHETGLSARGVAGDQFALNAAAPITDPPGARWFYNTPVYHLLVHIVARATGERFEDYAQRKLIGPLGMSGTTWLTNTGKGATGPVTNYYTALCTARDLARLGLFAQRGGQWAGKRLVNASYWKASISPSQTVNPAYGYLWWVNAAPGFPAVAFEAPAGKPGLRFAGSPPDTFAALGAGGQVCIVSPSLDLVVVRQGDNPGPNMHAELMASLISALKT